jgi:hypothetical protein
MITARSHSIREELETNGPNCIVCGVEATTVHPEWFVPLCHACSEDPDDTIWAAMMVVRMRPDPKPDDEEGEEEEIS